MNRLDEMFVMSSEQKERLTAIGKLADSFASEAHRVDAEHDFAFEHIEALRKLNYFSYTVPREFGGEGITLYEFVMLQERLAQGDAAIALGVGWHLSVMFELNLNKPWSEAALAALNEQVVKQQILVNRAATEKASGSPTRGGKPQTTALQCTDGSYVLNGRKTFTTLSPVLDYFLVTAGLDEDTVEFMIPRTADGLRIEQTWNMLGMRGTASHDLVMEEVLLPASALMQVFPKKKAQLAAPHLLHIPACYLGIALAARKEAIKFAYSYQPNSLSTSIIHVPHIVQQLGQIELELQTARHFMYSVAARWDQQVLPPEQLSIELNAVKVTAIQTALSVVDKAMRIVGAHSLALDHPLQRMYRDVRFGLHNPPMEDAVLSMLGRLAIKDIELELEHKQEHEQD
ncbi:acyl-CoA dehydrogenase family protein [Paenibacillus camelliae]|uniref:acyl-CoA dehydrogenase family protein n=1 Tax=Paenibacillus camelliae TaxID=512410 RepID=UPI00204200CC|nr:acyl-CoA dehydrogenase family protein [Paenibacillus camelliae]MCM3635832.1 acyl-CoA/acyl-ACP dehydrogenase [Paenibacillus camelliae]